MLPFEVLQDLVADVAAAGFDVLSVSGGEPLLYRELERLLACAKRSGLTTTITTNGLLLTGRRLEQLAGCVDLIAVSLDGTPDDHDRMRGRRGAFERMSTRLAGLRDSGIPFGFVFTLTQWNVDQLEWIADFAESSGASLLQVHPLELEGFAARTLAEASPDGLELMYAAAEVVRLAKGMKLYFQLDATYRADLLREPTRFLAMGDPPAMPLGSWLSPIVLETDGSLVPITYGFPRQYAIGNVIGTRFEQLVARWDPQPLLDLATRTWHELTADGGPAVFNWYETLTRAARSQTPSVLH